MCGLFGILGAGVTNTDLGALETLAIVSALRGTDSTGICQGRQFWRKNETEYSVDKGTFNIIEFLKYHAEDKEGNRKVMNDTGDNFFLCHVRHATKGLVTPDNAHPFELDTLVGMHNGTLNDDKYRHATKTDSELLFEDIEKNGILPVLQGLNPLTDHFALVILDKETGKVHFVRNEKRPLYMCFHKTRRVMYYASEEAFLRFMIDRQNLDCGDIKPFEANVVYSVDPWNIENDSRMDLETEPLFPKGELALPAPRRAAKAKAQTYPNQGTITDHTFRKQNERNSANKNGKPGKVGDDGKVINFGRAKEDRKVPKLIGFAQPPAKKPSTDFHSPWHNEDGICVLPRSFPKVKCIYCSEPMNLYQQWMGNSLHGIGYACERCEDLNKATFEASEEVRVH